MDVVVQHGGLMIKLCKGQGKFYQCIFQESKTVNPNISANDEGIYT